ncbi:MAG TPA: hypothetical protein PLM73_09335 [Petrotogaceae bacterium]|nr:hypothetical protein [Petrotogaceae bacterium]HQI79401.1 hypothetical protein [Petrotogaceae bacterium]
MLVDFFNAIFRPSNIFQHKKESLLIPLIIIIIFLFTPVWLFNWKASAFLFVTAYLGASARNIFSDKNLFIPYIITFSPLIFGALGKDFLIASFIWMQGLRSYIDIKNKNCFSLIIGISFELFLLWWFI